MTCKCVCSRVAKYIREVQIPTEILMIREYYLKMKEFPTLCTSRNKARHAGYNMMNAK